MRETAMSKVGRKSTARRIPISIRLEGAIGVVITGDFNRWDENGVPLSYDGRGIWRTALDLMPGEYQYRLIVDGKWRDDPEAEKRVPNPFGSENCVLVVT